MHNFLFLFVFVFIFSFKISYSANPVILTPDNDSKAMRGEYVSYIKDFNDQLNIQDILSGKYDATFETDATEEIVTYNHAVTYWGKVTVINTCRSEKHWVIELFEPKIEHFEIYIINRNGKRTVYQGGAIEIFDKKSYYHKNYIYDLPLGKGETIDIYLKLKVKRRGVMLGVIRTVQKLVGYASTEYFFLALFYGICIAIIFSNLFLFLLLGDRTYLYYTFYILGIAMYSLCQDGLGFQYLWPGFPILNEKAFPVATFLMIFFALLYGRNFLHTKELSRKIVDRGILALLGIRTILFISWLFFPAIGFITWIDILPLFYLYLTGAYLWMKGYRVARFYALAFTLFFVGFFLSVLQHLHLIKANVYTTYSFNMGVLGEMFLLSLALADKVKVLTRDREIAQEEKIVQLRDKESEIEKANKNLEQKIKERTKALEDKNKELDTFVYRSSHDIKGPLKSIIGATSLALVEVEEEISRNYFDHILKSSKQLDEVVDHLLAVIQIKEKDLQIDNINIQEVFNRSLKQMRYLEDYYEVRMAIDQSSEFYSDDHLLSSMFLNILHLSFQFRNPTRKDGLILIEGSVSAYGALISFTDNGMGIDKHIQEKIFDVFPKTTSGTTLKGFSLYLTKVFVERLGGDFVLESEQGNGAKYSVNLKNYKSTHPS